MKKEILQWLLALLTGFASTGLHAQEEDEFKLDEVEMSLSLYAGLSANYNPWKSFSDFRKEYNSVNAPTLQSQLGSMSDQYGTKLGMEFFISKHYYSSIDWNRVTSRTSAQFNNDARRYFAINTNTINCFIGWKQVFPKSALTLSTGFAFMFGRVNGWIKFPDGTNYYNTQGFSGEFTDVNFGVPLKFDYERAISKRLSWKVGLQAQFFNGTFKEGMQNVFVTQTTSSIGLNQTNVMMDLTGYSLNAGIVINLYTL